MLGIVSGAMEAQYAPNSSGNLNRFFVFGA
jgi:hypothetical protein